MFKTKYGSWCVIAGGSEGIGAAFAHEAAARGINLVLLARKPGPLEKTADEVREAYPTVEVRTLSIDMSDPRSAEEIKTATADLEVGLLIFNAGAETTYGRFLDRPWDEVEGRLQRNFVIKTNLLHHFGNEMRQRRRGGIILMGSLSGYLGSPGFALYAASKAFTHLLAEGLWFEMAQDNVDMLCTVVGPTDTPAMKTAYGPMEGMHKTDPAFVARGSFERLGDGPMWVAGDIADAVASLQAMQPRERSIFGAKMNKDFVETCAKSAA